MAEAPKKTARASRKKPATEPAEGEAVAAEPAAKAASKPAAKAASEPAAKPESKPAAKAASEPAAKPASKAASKTAPKPASKADSKSKEASSKTAPKPKDTAAPKAARASRKKAALPAEPVEETNVVVTATAPPPTAKQATRSPVSERFEPPPSADDEVDDAADDAADEPKPEEASAPAESREPRKPAASRAAVAQPPAPVSPPDFPDTDYAVVEKLLVGFVRAEVRKVGLSRAVLGLSGGVDSAVSAAIAARALGPDNVLGVMMPHTTSSPESEQDAHVVAAAIGIETTLVPIAEQIEAYFRHFPDASALRRGNKMARERMTILYDLSATRSALVIGTSNKTELLLGYGTLHGDMASALNPIGDLYKTQVWGLARHLGLPASVIEKAPTADLWRGQTDESELGFSYGEVDRLLYRLVDERTAPAELVEMGFDAAFVDRVGRMVRSSQFKRRLPIIAKISARSIDTDFRYPRDWGF